MATFSFGPFFDAADPQIQQTLDQLANAYYAIYAAANRRTLRTLPQSDAASITRYGLQRRRSIRAETSNVAVAERIAAAATLRTLRSLNFNSAASSSAVSHSFFSLSTRTSAATSSVVTAGAAWRMGRSSWEIIEI
jgi:hypothetical protein